MTYRQVKQIVNAMSESQLDQPFLVFDADEEVTVEADMTISNEGNLKHGFKNRQPMVFTSKTSRLRTFSNPVFLAWLDSIAAQGGFGQVE